MGLFVFEAFDVSALPFCGAADATVAALEGILACHLDALVFLLGGAVDHEARDEGCAHTVGRDGKNLDFLVKLVEIEAVPLPYFHLVGGFQITSLTRQFHFATLAGISGEGACLVETHGPKVFVESHQLIVKM